MAVQQRQHVDLARYCTFLVSWSACISLIFCIFLVGISRFVVDTLHPLAPPVYGLSGLCIWNYFTDSYNLVELCCMHGSGRQECGE